MSRSFVMDRCLGKGGFGEVYAATMVADAGPGTPVAVKLLRESLGDNDQAVRRMKEEGRLLKRLSHPNILEIVDLTRLADRVALVTEYVDGSDLSTLIEEGDLPPRVVLEIVAAIARALHAAFTAEPDAGRGPLRLVHRDVKPSNIRIGRDGRVVLLDFGIARSDEVTRGIITASDLLVGSAPYLAPERFRKGPPLLASDVFALGATAYEVLAGERLLTLALPVQAAHSLDSRLWSSFLAGRLVKAGRALEPAALRTFVASLLVNNPDERPSAEACAERAEMLAELVRGPTLASWARTRRWPPPTLVTGSLAGQTLEESQLQFRPTEVRPGRALSTASMIETIPAGQDLGESPPPPPARASSRTPLLVLGVGLLLGLAVAATVLSLVAAGLWQSRSGSLFTTPETASTQQVEDVTTLPPPAPTFPEPVTVQAPRKASASIPAPAAEPRPARSPVPLARVRIDTDQRPVWMTRADTPGGRIDLGATWTDVEPGLYHVLTVFDDASAIRAIQNLQLRPGFETTIHCDWRMNRCAPE